MRVRDHLALAAAGAALLGPRAGRRALGLLAASVLIDVDHYIWFCLRHRRLNPVAAIRFFNAAHTPRHPATRLLHTRPALLAVLAVAIRRPALRPVALGMSLHAALDAYHEARMGAARETALERDGFSCRACGARAPGLQAHAWRQPWVLPSYRPANLISLCGPCHERAHSRGTGPGPWT